MSHLLDLLNTAVQYGVKAPAEQVKSWTERRGVPALIGESTTGWTWLFVLVDGNHVVGTRPAAIFETLRELHRLGQAVMIIQDEVWGAANGTIRQLPNGYQMPEWEAELARQRGVVILPAGSDLLLVRAVAPSPMTVVRSDKWDIAGTESGAAAGVFLSMAEPERGPVVALDRQAEEVVLAVFRGGELHGAWVWNPSRTLVNHPPPNLLLPVDVSWLYQTPDPRVVFGGAPGVDVDRLARAVAGTAPGAAVVSELAAALGLPAFVEEHLAGTRDLAGHPEGVPVRPLKGIRGFLGLRRFRRFF